MSKAYIYIFQQMRSSEKLFNSMKTKEAEGGSLQKCQTIQSPVHVAAGQHKL